MSMEMMEEHTVCEAPEQPAIWSYPLEGLLAPGQRLALSPTLGVLVLIEQSAEDGPQVCGMHQFTPNELSVLLPLLSWYPDFAPYEYLLAHFESGSQQISDEQI